MKLIQSVKRRMGANESKAAPARVGTPSTAASTANAQSFTPTSIAAPAKAASTPPSGGPAAATSGVKAPPSSLPRNAGGTSGEDNPFAYLPSLRDAPASEKPELFRKKLQACSVIFDFTQPNLDTKEKDAKKAALLEIVEHVNNTRNCFNDQVMSDVVNMVSANLFRSLPPSTAHSSLIYDPEEDEPTLDTAWPHLQIVYEFFLRFVVCTDVDPKVAKKFIDSSFVLKLLQLFNSEDPRERDYLKTILHRIYGKFMGLRSFVRKAVQHIFFKFIYETEMINGIPELLEILGSIINGFAQPLKDEHKQFLERSLIPLHKAKTLNAFHQQLSYCMTQYVEKENRLAELIIWGILRYWPVTNTIKEVLFLNELEELMEMTQQKEFQKLMEVLFKKMAACIMSPHFQVAERVLFLWNNDHIVKLINENRSVLFPIVIGALFKNSKHHWNNTVHGLTYNVLKLLMETDPSLFDESTVKHRANEEKQKQIEEDRLLRWARIQKMYDEAI